MNFLYVCLCLQSSSTELLQKVCEVVKRGLEALAKGAATLAPQDCSAFTDFAFMQVHSHLVPHAFLACWYIFFLTFTEFIY